LDARLAGDVADLPVGTPEPVLHVEVRRDSEVALAARGELDVALDPGDAERALRVAVEIMADDVPAATLVVQRIRLDRALGVLAAGDRPVLELDCALLRDRALELREPAGHLRRVIGVEHLDALRGRVRRLGEAGPAEGEVLEREPERFGVRE